MKFLRLKRFLLFVQKIFFCCSKFSFFCFFFSFAQKLVFCETRVSHLAFKNKQNSSSAVVALAPDCPRVQLRYQRQNSIFHQAGPLKSKRMRSQSIKLLITLTHRLETSFKQKQLLLCCCLLFRSHRSRLHLVIVARLTALQGHSVSNNHRRRLEDRNS